VRIDGATGCAVCRASKVCLLFFMLPGAGTGIFARLSNQMSMTNACCDSKQESRPLLWFVLTLALLCNGLNITAQTAPAEDATMQTARTLIAEQHWQEVVSLLSPLHMRTAETDFDLGTALARLDRWPEAAAAFEAGRRLAPTDPKFPVELAGIAFRQKNYPRAVHLLQKALRLSPQDRYANDFLGTVYFLEGNLEASLKYWNLVGKPEIATIHEDPLPQVSPALLDRAFGFSPAGVLQLPEFLDTNARVRGLGVFPQYQFDLNAREDGRFDVLFRGQELDGFGSTKLEQLFLLFRGLPFSSVNPEYYNLNHEAINFVSMYRWDAQKRRIYAELSSPFEHSAKYRYEFVADLRDENWVIRNSFTGPAPALASLNLRREQIGFAVASFASGRWYWSGEAAFSHRDFRSVVPGTVLTPGLLAKGYQLEQRVQAGATVWRVPERRFTLNAGVSSQAARMWSEPEESYEKLQGSLGWRWLPQAVGDDYEMLHQFRAGKTFGQVPFDELFMLGLERDNDLAMRAHIGTRDGRKGSAPLGRNYLLFNWEADKNLNGNGILSVKAGPFIDTGQITDPIAALGSHKWLCDIGAQTKFRVFGRGVAFSYGKDLRSGNNAFYLTVLKTGAERE
jgi:tetratricopeptide (TPR) repeat protein